MSYLSSLALAVTLLGAFSSCSKSDRDDLKAPLITAVSPGANATDVAPGAEIRVTFDQKIRVSTLNQQTFFLRDVAQGITVPAHRSYYPSNRTAVLRPTEPLVAGRQYQATVGKDVKSERFGIALKDGPRIWRFTVRNIGTMAAGE